MGGFHLLIRITFSLLTLTQIAIILTGMIITLKAGDNLGLLSLLDLIFPLVALIGVWKYNKREKDPVDKTCLKARMLFILYIIWCICWVIIGIFLVLVRSGTIVIQTDNSVAHAFLGDVNGTKSWDIISITIVQIVLQAIGFVYGIALAVKSKPDTEKTAGFV